MIKLRSLLIENHEQIVEKVKNFLVYEFDRISWHDFIDKQEMGDCQLIVSDIIRNFPEFKKVFGEIQTDEPYIDTNNEEQNLMVHHWVKLNNVSYDFSKGTLKNYIKFNNLYDVNIEDENRYHIIKI
jgi:hypothetical protein